MHIEALDYELPSQQIASEPAEPRDASRLMVIDRTSGKITHHRVCDLAASSANLLGHGDLLIMNRTKVLPASFMGTRRATNGKVRGLYLASDDPKTWVVMLESRGRLVAGDVVDLGLESCLELLAPREKGCWTVRVDSPLESSKLLDRVGTAPLPPYIRRQRRARREPELRSDDLRRYNTVFGDRPGSVAAPTASLHFTSQLLADLRNRGIGIATLCLHVGLGTFAPIRTTDVAAHHIHREWIEVPGQTLAALRLARAEDRRIIPIGTTAVRAVESLPDPLPPGMNDFHGSTELFIHPDAVHDGTFRFRFTDVLMTNFHLPRSSLLALVAALPDVGIDRLMQWYAAAIREGYRFYSYGDAMILL